MLPANLDYAAPATIEDAVALLGSQPDALVVAGGYRTIVDLKMRRLAPGLLVDLYKIPALYGITTSSDGVRLGAMMTLRAILDDQSLGAYGALVEAAEASGDPQSRNMDTIGGTISYDAQNSDLATALLVLDATIHTAGTQGAREIAPNDFFATGLAQGEFVTAVTLPGTSGVSAYEKFKHPATFAPVCGVAVSLTLGANHTVETCTIAVTGATSHPTRLASAEAALQGQPLDANSIAQAAAAAGKGADFITDLYTSGEYRAQRLQSLLKHAFARLA